MINRRTLGMAGLPFLIRPAMAQTWPSRPIRLVVPWPPGQATDQVGRLMAQRLSERLGQPIVPENRPGAGGSIGTDIVAKAVPDGHTLLAASIGPISLGPLIHRTPYDVDRDLAPVARFSGSPYILVARAEFPPPDARALLALLRANPGKYTYASSGAAGSQHVLTALFLARANVEALHIPYLTRRGVGLAGMGALASAGAVRPAGASWLGNLFPGGRGMTESGGVRLKQIASVDLRSQGNAFFHFSKTAWRHLTTEEGVISTEYAGGCTS